MGPEMRKSVYITGAVDEKQLLRNEYLPLSAKFYLADKKLNPLGNSMSFHGFFRFGGETKDERIDRYEIEDGQKYGRLRALRASRINALRDSCATIVARQLEF